MRNANRVTKVINVNKMTATDPFLLFELIFVLMTI